MDSITANKLECILSGNGVSSDEFNEVIDLMDNYAKEYHQAKLQNHSDLSHVSDNEERVAVVCSTCNWQHAKYEYKCEGCTLTYKNWEQDTDR